MFLVVRVKGTWKYENKKKEKNRMQIKMQIYFVFHNLGTILALARVLPNSQVTFGIDKSAQEEISLHITK